MPSEYWMACVADETSEGLIVHATAVGETQYDALLLLLETLNDEPQHYPVVNPSR